MTVQANKSNLTINSLCTAWEGKGNWEIIAPVAWNSDDIFTGDFNGDGRDDIMRADGASWYFYNSGSGVPKRWTGSAVRANEVVVADFTGDGKVDALASWSNKWFLLESNGNGFNGGWREVGSSSYQVTSLGLGDFNGDGKSDLLRTSAGKWYVSFFGATSFSPWTEIASSSYTLNNIKIGDFNGDGFSDVICRSSNNWLVSVNNTAGGMIGWTTFKENINIAVSEMHIADFDGDGKDDVFTTASSSGLWQYSKSFGTYFSDLSNLNSSDFTLDSLRFADFDGDQLTDVFTIKSPINNAVNLQAFLPEQRRNTNSLEEVELFLYPNPTSGYLYLNTSLQNIRVSIRDLQGREVINTMTTSFSNRFDLKGLLPGMYVVELNNGNSRSLNKIILK